MCAGTEYVWILYAVHAAQMALAVRARLARQRHVRRGAGPLKTVSFHKERFNVVLCACVLILKSQQGCEEGESPKSWRCRQPKQLVAIQI